MPSVEKLSTSHLYISIKRMSFKLEEFPTLTTKVLITHIEQTTLNFNYKWWMDQPHSINYNRTQQIGNIRHQQTGKRNNYRLIYVKHTEKTSQIFHTTLKQKHGLSCVSSELTLKYQYPTENKRGKKRKSTSCCLEKCHWETHVGKRPSCISLIIKF